MSLLDAMQRMFGQAPAAMPGAAARQGDGLQAFLQNSGLMPEVDKKKEMRRAISRGLADFSKAMTSNNGDFLPALASGLSAGAGGFLDARDETEAKEKARGKAILDLLMGAARTDEANDIREAKNAATQDYNDQRLNLMQDRLSLMEKLGLGRLEQGDRRIDVQERQGDARLNETGRHNRATEADSDQRLNLMQDRLSLMEKLGLGRLEQGDRRIDVQERQGDARLNETGRHNRATEADSDQRIAQAEQRLAAQAEKAKADAAKISAGADSLKVADKKASIESKMQAAKLNKAKELGLDNPSFRALDPEGHAAAVLQLQAYSDNLDRSIKGTGQNSLSASPAPQQQPGAGTPQVKHDEKNPARPMSRAEYDALPPGSVFINPKDGKLKRKPLNGQAAPQ